jgi:hypothetical protein
MLVLDNNLLSDYLNGVPAARRFLEDYEREPWAVPSIVLFEAFMGCLYGYIEADPTDVRYGVQSSMEVLSVTEETAYAGFALQRELMKRGVPVDQLDALIVAAAHERGATFATAEKQFWREEVKAVLSIAEYDPH